MTTMAVPRHVDRRTFLAYLRQSGLLDREQLAAAAAPRLPESPRGRVLARALVEQGLLTRFQAEQLLAGRTSGFFLDQYRILEQIGQGGMGRVFKAEHRTMGRTVALKVLTPRLLKTPRAQALFLREVRAIAQAVHPNIVTAFDANQVNGRHYLVLEYVNGPNLDQLVRDTGPLPAGQACDFVRQVADGLQHAFRLGMVHRDIKPANLLLQRGSADQRGTYGQVKISDFGLARLGDDVADDPDTILTRANAVMGTPDYIAPEQARDLHRTDIRSDLYSLGGTFYYLLTGQVPFPGGSVLEKLVRHGTEEPAPLEQLRPDVPPAVAAVVRRLMAKKPEDRFQTPAELAGALAPFAVSCPAAWSGPRPAEPFADLQPTPVAEDADDADPLADLEGLDDSAALIGTLPADGSPTPLSGVGLVSSTRLSRGERARRQRRLRLALLCAVGIVGALLAAGAALAVVLGYG